MIIAKNIHVRWIVLFSLGLFIVAIIATISWCWALEYGKGLNQKIYVYHNGMPFKNGLVYVTLRKRRWHWYYQEAIVGSRLAKKLEKQTLGVGQYMVTDARGAIALHDRAVELTVLAYDGPASYELYSKELSFFTTIPNRLDIERAMRVFPIYYDPEFYFASSGSDKPKNGATAGNTSLSNTNTRFAESTLEKGKTQFSLYYERLGDSCDVLFLRVESDNGDQALVEKLPYEIRFHEKNLLFVRSITSNLIPNKKNHICVSIFVPKNHKYDIVFHPDETAWPGSEYSLVLPKPLEPLTVRNIQPRHLPKEPFETIILKHTEDYTPDWEERALAQRMSRENLVRKLSPILLKLQAASRSLMEHWALVLLVLVPFVAPWIVQRVLGSREKEADKGR